MHGGYTKASWPRFSDDLSSRLTRKGKYVKLRTVDEDDADDLAMNKSGTSEVAKGHQEAKKAKKKMPKGKAAEEHEKRGQHLELTRLVTDRGGARDDDDLMETLGSSCHNRERDLTVLSTEKM